MVSGEREGAGCGRWWVVVEGGLGGGCCVLCCVVMEEEWVGDVEWGDGVEGGAREVGGGMVIQTIQTMQTNLDLRLHIFRHKPQSHILQANNK